MPYQKYLDHVFNSLKIAIPSIFIGVVGTYISYDSVVLVGKNNEISSLKASVEVEKGRQNVLTERIKLLGDKAVFLEDRLKYKPSMQVAEEEKFKELINKLSKENKHLQELKISLEKAEGSQIDLAKLNIRLEKYITENESLKQQLSQFDSEIIVENFKLNTGESWSGFGGQATFGISKIDRDYKKGNVAVAISSIFKSDSTTVQAGDSFKFEISSTSYNLIVSSVNYVGDFATISVYKKI